MDRLTIIKGHIANLSLPSNISFSNCSQVVSSQASPYLYTLDTNILTTAQRNFYEQNGFLVVKKLVPQNKLDTFNQRFKDICGRKVVIPGMTVMRDVAIAKSEFVPGEQAVTKVQHFVDDEILFSYCSLPEILQYVQCFCGPNVRAMHTMLINKPPDPGSKSSRHPMHQDLYYFPFRPAERIVCAWTAMERVTRANGCLVVVPGTHRGDLLPHDYPKWEGGVNKLYHGITTYRPDDDRVHLEMEAGDTVFFHPVLIHGSGMNRTNGFRKAISCHYAAAECHYIDVAGTLQEVVSKEMIALAAKKFGPELAQHLTYQDVWRLRSRMVAGRDIDQ